VVAPHSLILIGMNTKYTIEMLTEAAKASTSVADVMRKLGIKRAGGSHAHLSRRLKFFEVDTSHFTGKTKSKGRPSPKKKSWQEILVLRHDGRRQHAVILRRALIESGRKYECELCGLPPWWNEKELRFQVNHKSRNWCDDRPGNLQFACPNCHTQTEGYNGSKGLSSVVGRASNEKK
jgi:hypothetical protein